MSAPLEPFGTAPARLGPGLDARGARVVARTLYRMLRARGLESRHLLGVATEMLALVAEEMRAAR